MKAIVVIVESLFWFLLIKNINLSSCSLLKNLASIQIMLLHSGTGLVADIVVSVLSKFHKRCFFPFKFSNDELLLSVCSAVGVLPLSLQYGFPIVEKYASLLYILLQYMCTVYITQHLISFNICASGFWRELRALINICTLHLLRKICR